MKDIITRYNIDKILKELGNLKGVSIMINDTWLGGVEGIVIKYIPIDPDIPEECLDGSQEDRIEISFSFRRGKASVHFCPDIKTCEIWHEQEDLLIFRIENIPDYVERRRDYLNFLEKEYADYMNK